MSSDEEYFALVNEQQRRDAMRSQAIFHDRYMSKNPDGTNRWPAENGEVHYEVYRYLDDPEEDHLVLIFPREHAKTVKYNEEYILKEVLSKPGSYALILRESEQDAVENVKSIKTEIEENPFIAADFGDQVGKTWTDLDIFLANGSRVRGAGKKASLRGTKKGDQRPTHVVMDDIQKLENIESALGRDRDWRWVLTTVLPVGTVGTQYLIVGNKIHRDGIIARAEKNAAWRTVFYQAWRDTERTKPLWPEFWPPKRLRSKELELGRTEFEREFMNNPRDSESAIFDEKDFTFEDPPVPVNDLERIYAWVDPAQGKKDSDISAIAVLGSWMGTIYVLEAWMERKGVVKTIDAGYSMAETIDINQFGIENNTYRDLMNDRLKQEREDRGSSLPWKTFVSTKSKQIRIAKLEAPIQTGTLKFARKLKESVLIQQFLDYHAHRDDEDDGPDAVAGAYSMFPRTGFGSPKALDEDSREPARIIRIAE